jgi:hypothetical protein
LDPYGDRRASAILARAQRREVRPNILASLRSESGLPAFRAEPVRGHGCVIIGIGFESPVTMLPAGRDGRLPTLTGLIAVVPAVLLALNGCGWGGTRHIAARRRWLAFQRPGGADKPDQEFIGAREAGRWPGRDHGPDGAV